MNTMEIYKKVDQLRKDKHWSNYKLSTEATISHSTLYSWRARKTMPSIDVLEKICVALNYPLSKLLFDFESQELSEEQRRVMELWGVLTREQKNAVISILRAMVKER